jgi:hypothetical protein
MPASGEMRDGLTSFCERLNLADPKSSADLRAIRSYPGAKAAWEKLRAWGCEPVVLGRYLLAFRWCSDRRRSASAEFSKAAKAFSKLAEDLERDAARLDPIVLDYGWRPPERNLLCEYYRPSLLPADVGLLPNRMRAAAVGFRKIAGRRITDVLVLHRALALASYVKWATRGPRYAQAAILIEAACRTFKKSDTLGYEFNLKVAVARSLKLARTTPTR